MRRHTCILCFALLACLPAAAQGERAIANAESSAPSAAAALQGPRLLAALRRGGYVVYFRHTATDFSKNDAAMLKQFVYRKDAVTDTLVQPYQVPFARQGFSAGLGDWATAFANASCEGVDSLDPRKLRAWAASGPSVALIWGERDAITPIAQARALQSWMPSATLATLPDVGHIPHIESPSAFAATLIRQLR